MARSQGALLSRLMWPVGILFVGTMVMASAMLWRTSLDADRDAQRSQRERLAAGIAMRLDRLGNSLLGYLDGHPELADRPGIVDGATGRMTSLEGAAILPSPEGILPPATEDAGGPDPFGLTELGTRFRDFWSRLTTDLALRRDGEPRRVSGLSIGDGEAHYAVFALLPRRGAGEAPFGEPVLAWTAFDDSALLRIAQVNDLKGFRIGQAKPETEPGGLPVLDAAGAVAGEMTWMPDLPGETILRRVGPLMAGAFGITSVLFIGIGLYLRRATATLVEVEAVSKQLLGRDPLSGLANRMLFNERLERELRRVSDSGGGLAVMFIDLDRFKDVNDTYGHQAGDDLIRLVAERLLTIVPGGDTLARFGGDEFAVIQVDVSNHSAVEKLSRQILDALTEPFCLTHGSVTIGASIGVAMAPEHARDREGLMKLADTALYGAKSEGRNRTIIFQRRMDETLRMRKVVEDDLRQAIESDRLVLHYQPVVSSDGDTVVGLEALVRWPHPTRGMISPVDFIPVAEERGLIIPLGEWVLRRACLDAQRWPGLRVAVNVSPIQFRHRNFVARIVKVLAETGFDATRLELELTEGVVVADADAAEAAMIELRALGVHLALDDFGTGYSSLIYLRRFAFDKIKIDRSFLESMEATGESAILVHSIVHLGRALGLTVTAEGVETKEQHRFLQALGCHQLQGFLFSRPVPAEAIDALLGISGGEEIATAETGPSADAA